MILDSCVSTHANSYNMSSINVIEDSIRQPTYAGLVTTRIPWYPPPTYTSLVFFHTRKLQQFGEVRCAEASDRIPPLRDRKSLYITAIAESLRNVGQTLVAFLV
jgi:hypothetical protein